MNPAKTAANNHHPLAHRSPYCQSRHNATLHKFQLLVQVPILSYLSIRCPPIPADSHLSRYENRATPQRRTPPQDTSTRERGQERSRPEEIGEGQKDEERKNRTATPARRIGHGGTRAPGSQGGASAADKSHRKELRRPGHPPSNSASLYLRIKIKERVQTHLQLSLDLLAVPSSTCIVTCAWLPFFNSTGASPTVATSSAGSSRIPYTNARFAITHSSPASPTTASTLHPCPHAESFPTPTLYTS